MKNQEPSLSGLFRAAPGEVSPSVYTYTDKVNYFNKNYVIAGLKAINPPGKMTLAEAKETLKNEVLNAKKGEILAGKISSKDLNAIASNFGTVIDTASNVSFIGGFIPKIGAEPKVVAKVFAAKQGDVVGPIVGKSGVYVIRLISKIPPIASNNVEQLRKALNGNTRRQVAARLWKAVKENVEIEDNRSKFY